MNLNLKEWFYPQAKKLAIALGRPDDEIKWKGRIPILVEDAWNHQQQTIEELKTHNKALNSCIDIQKEWIMKVSDINEYYKWCTRR